LPMRSSTVTAWQKKSLAWPETRGLVLPGKQPARPTEAEANPIDGEVLDTTARTRSTDPEQPLGPAPSGRSGHR
jgi:hypothetical protein